MSDVVANPVLAEVIRSGFVESRHRGSIVAIAPDGTYAFTAGGANAPIFPRSSNKPLQAAAMLRAGLPIEGELLALAAASHSGEDFHVQGVHDILDYAGLTADDLRCPPSLPIDEPTARRLIRSCPPDADPASRVRFNCSGKHAAMLATCIANDWPTETYLSPEHPLQVHIRRTIEDLAREPVAAVGVDGCGAPLFSLTLGGLARAFRAPGPRGAWLTGAQGRRRDAQVPRVDQRDDAGREQADGVGPRAAAQVGRRGRGRVRAAGRHGGRGQDRRR